MCDGDGHSEACLVEFDPQVVSYDEIVRHFFENPKVRSVLGEQKAQYKTAVWAHNEEQMKTAKRVAAECGKTIPVLGATQWYDAEARHQRFFG